MGKKTLVSSIVAGAVVVAGGVALAAKSYNKQDKRFENPLKDVQFNKGKSEGIVTEDTDDTTTEPFDFTEGTSEATSTSESSTETFTFTEGVSSTEGSTVGESLDDTEESTEEVTEEPTSEVEIDETEKDK